MRRATLSRTKNSPVKSSSKSERSDVLATALSTSTVLRTRMRRGTNFARLFNSLRVGQRIRNFRRQALITDSPPRWLCLIHDLDKLAPLKKRPPRHTRFHRHQLPFDLKASVDT